MARVSTADLDRSMPLMARADPASQSEPLTPLPPPRVMRHILLVLAGAAAGAALLLMASLGHTPQTGLAASAYLALALLCGLCWWLPAAWQMRGMVVAIMAAMLTVGLSAATLGWGLSTPALNVLPVTVCLVTAVLGWRRGLLPAFVGLLVLATVAWVRAGQPLLPGAPPLPLQLAAHLLTLAVAFGGGAVLAQLVARAMKTVHDREQRFRAMLALAADAYWEIDRNYRLVAAGQPRRDGLVQALGGDAGVVPWELPQFGCEPETLDLLLADLGSRVAFRDLPVTWTDSDGQLHHYLASGEPRFDIRGLFKGYWGVARDVTAVERAKKELEATETRYQDLSPTSPRRWCCTAAAGCWTPTRPAWRCLATRTWPP